MPIGIRYFDYAILVFAIVVVSLLILRILRFFLNRFIRKSSQQLNVDPTKYYFLKSALNFVVVFIATIAILFSIPELKQFGFTLFAGAGILAAIIGFASQAAFSNIIGGIFIVIFKPFRIGDTVKISNLYFGTVEDLTLRHTVIRDIENKRYILPNSLVSSEVIHNYVITDERVSNQIYFAISYATNIDNAIRIIREQVEKHPYFRDHRTQEEVDQNYPMIPVRVMSWEDSSIKLRATVWTDDPDQGFELKCELLKTVKEQFDKESIEIPFPHRTVVIKK